VPSAVGPLSPAIASVRVAKPASSPGSSIGGEMSVSDAIRSGCFVARPRQSPGTSRPAAICARWIPRWSNSSTTHSSTERISPVILDLSQQHWAPSGSGGTRTRHHRFASTKRRLVSIFRSRMSRLPMALVLGTQESRRTQPSRVNAMRTRLPF